MKILHISLSNIGGGASVIARSLNLELNKAGISSHLVTIEGIENENCSVILKSKVDLFFFRLKNQFSKLLLSNFQNQSQDYRSLNIFSSRLINFINISDADIVHLHWVGAETLSLKNIVNIKKTIVWTLHDAWALNGTYHITPNQVFNQNIGTFSKLFEEFFYNRKKNILSNCHINFIAPSKFLWSLYKNSFYNPNTSTCTYIPNFLNNTHWEVHDKLTSRKYLNIESTGKKIILIGGFNIFSSFNKGAKYFKQLSELLDKTKYTFIHFGNDIESINPFKDFDFYSFGVISDLQRLNFLYSAADVTIVPSIFESFSLVSLESVICGTPVVAFNNSGITDIITHKINGYLAKFDDANDLCNGIDWVCNNLDKIDNLILSKFSTENVIDQHIDFYKKLLTE
jgi:glycosyltransferase involved in cell wall biosynthesis